MIPGQWSCVACGWFGVAQNRPSWPTCPRCGEGACAQWDGAGQMPATVAGPDCPSGVQPEERAPALAAMGVSGPLLYWLAELADRVETLEGIR